MALTTHTPAPSYTSTPPLGLNGLLEGELIFSARSKICGKRLLAFSCLSVCPHGRTGPPLEGFLLNLVFEDF